MFRHGMEGNGVTGIWTGLLLIVPRRPKYNEPDTINEMLDNNNKDDDTGLSDLE